MKLTCKSPLVLFVGFVLSCGEDPVGAPDTPLDTASPDTADTTEDTTAIEDSDATSDGDTTPGGTLAGTTLEGLALEWADPLELCSGWSEGATLADEKARKVRVVIPPQARTSLDEAPLAASRLAGLDLMRGPDAAQRFHPDPSGESTRVTTWQLTRGRDADYLTASVAHTLAGGAGTLHETWSIGRAPGDTRPIVVTSDTWEVRFAYQAPEGDLDPAPLERCGGAADHEDAVSVLVARDEGGKRWATLVRYWRTPDDGGVTAGSYPVTLIAQRLVTSEAPWRPDEAAALWANTYVAQHHNFDDASEIDFTRDLGRWHTVHRVPDPLATPVARVTLAGVLGFDAASMTIERWGAEGPLIETLPIPEPRRFPRVDAAALGRQLAMTCADGEVLASGGGDFLFQMLFCDDGGRRALVGIVPVVWSREPTLAGELIGGDTIMALGDRWEVSVGTDILALIPQAEGAMYAELGDAGGEIVASSWEVPYRLGPWPAPREETLGATSDDGAISFALVRRWAGLGVGKSQLWAPVRFTLSFDGVAHTVEAWDRLAYQNTHHNWNDVLEATTDDGIVLRWSTDFMNGVPNLVSATSPDGAVLLPPTTLPGQ